MMANMTVNMPDFMDALVLSEDDIKGIIESAAPAAEGEVKKAIRSSVSNPESSELVRSVRAYKTKKKKKGNGYVCFIGPSGTSKKRPDGSSGKKPVRNMEIAMYLNYGTTKEKARPWLDKASRNADEVCTQKMQEEYEKRIRK